MAESATSPEYNWAYTSLAEGKASLHVEENQHVVMCVDLRLQAVIDHKKICSHLLQLTI